MIKNYVQKILTFIVKDDKFLLLKGSDEDPQFHESFWYVVTGSVENEDKCLEDTVRRELKEETNLDVEEKDLELIDICEKVYFDLYRNDREFRSLIDEIKDEYGDLVDNKKQVKVRRKEK